MKVSVAGATARRQNASSTFQSQNRSPFFSCLDEGQPFRRRITPVASRCQGVSAIRIGQKFHHFMERSNVELCNRVDEFQPVTQRSDRIERLELNVVAVSPSLQKQEHP